MRGVSSSESAAIGGAAHLVNFAGGDTMEAIQFIEEYYNSQITNLSVVASEHSATIVYGKENEALAYKTFLDRHPEGVISIVADSYDLMNAVDNIFGKELRQQIVERDGKVVIRPDSGHPPTITVQVLKSLYKNFGGTINDKGYIELNPKVGVIYGDYISYGMIDDICEAMTEAGFSINNCIFGMGGALLQQVNRDTFKFAMKTCAVCINGEWKDVNKTPVTDPGKASKAGKLMLLKKDGKFVTQKYSEILASENLLRTIYKDGKTYNEMTFEEVRKESEKYL